jgi:hypothetical protein
MRVAENDEAIAVGEGENERSLISLIQTTGCPHATLLSVCRDPTPNTYPLRRELNHGGGETALNPPVERN